MKKRCVFFLNKKEKIILNSSIAWNKSTLLQEIHIIFQSRRIELMIGQGIVVNILQDIVNGLEDALQNKRTLSNSCICKGNLGLYAIKDFGSCILEESSNQDVLEECPHQSYRICAAKKRGAWIYNNAHGNIIFEITPWFEPTENTKKSIYEQWLQQYQPIVKRIIEPPVTQQWIAQMKTLLQIAKDNSKSDAE